MLTETALARYRNIRNKIMIRHQKDYKKAAELAEEQVPTFYGQDQFSGTQYAGLAPRYDFKISI